MHEESLAQLLAEVQALPATPTGPHLSDEEFVAFILAELAPDQEARLDAHLATCPACTETLDAFFAAVEGVPPATGEQPHLDFAHQLRTDLEAAERPPVVPGGPTRTGAADGLPHGVGAPSEGAAVISLRACIDRQITWTAAKKATYYDLVQVHKTLIQVAAGPLPAVEPLASDELKTPSRILYTAISKITGDTRWHVGPELLGMGAPLHIVSANPDGAEMLARGAVCLAGPEVVIDNARLRAHTSGVCIVTPADRYQRGRSAVFVVEPKPVESGGWDAEVLAEAGYAVEAWRHKVAEEGTAEELALFLLFRVVDAMVVKLQTYPQETLEDWGLVRHWNEMLRDLDPWREHLEQYCAAASQAR